MSKKKYDFANIGALVFSTDAKATTETTAKTTTPPLGDQNLSAIFSKKGRGGKIATIIDGFIGSAQDLKSLAKELKAACGVGGSVKDGQIIIQGNHRDKLMTLLQKKGYQVKRIGG